VEFQEHIINQLTPKEETKLSSGNFFVFINATRKDMSLAHEIKNFLNKKYEIKCELPLHIDMKPHKIRLDLETKLSECEAIILLYNTDTPIPWINEQMRCGKRIQSVREKPYKVFAVYDKPAANKLPLPINYLPNMLVLKCPELQTDTCLPEFIRSLK
jgi:hypothetical protein